MVRLLWLQFGVHSLICFYPVLFLNCFVAGASTCFVFLRLEPCSRQLRYSYTRIENVKGIMSKILNVSARSMSHITPLNIRSFPPITGNPPPLRADKVSAISIPSSLLIN